MTQVQGQMLLLLMLLLSAPLSRIGIRVATLGTEHGVKQTKIHEKHQCEIL